MTSQTSTAQKKYRKITIILAVVIVAAAAGIVATIALSGYSNAIPGSVSSSNSPFSPVINRDHSNPDPFANLAKKIEANPPPPHKIQPPPSTGFY